MNDEVGGGSASLPKSTQFILNITASCNKRMRRVRTLSISSIKSLVKAPFIGRLTEELNRSSVNIFQKI